MATPSSGLSNLLRLYEQQAPLPPVPTVETPPAVISRDLKRERREEEQKEDFLDQRIHAFVIKNFPKKSKIEEAIFKNSFKSRLSNSGDLDAAALFLSFSSESPEKMLREAVSQGLRSVVEKLIETGMDLDSEAVPGELSLVCLALNKGHMDIAALLIKAGAKDEKGQSKMIRAILNNELSILPAFLLIPEMLNDADFLGLTPLMHAVQTHNIQAFDLLLKAKPNLELTCKETFTVLHYAIWKGHLPMAAKLIENQANVDVATRAGITPLMLALSLDHRELVELLLQKRAKIALKGPSDKSVLSQVVKNNQHGYFSLFLEVLSKRSEGLSLTSGLSYLSSGFDEDVSEDFSLLIALRNGKSEMALELAKRGIGVHCVDAVNKESPLLWAAQQNLFPIVKILVAAGVDLDFCDQEKNSALDYAIAVENLKMEEFLVDEGALNAAGETPLTNVIQNGDIKVFEITLKQCFGKRQRIKGIDKGSLINKVNDESYSPLRLAFSQQHEEMITALLAAGANLSAGIEYDDDGCTVMGHAFKHEASNWIIFKLIEIGVDVNASLSNASFYDKVGYGFAIDSDQLDLDKPLRAAAFKGNLELMEVLVSKGANLGKYDNERSQETVLTILARLFEKGSKEEFELQEKVFQFLLDKGADINAQRASGGSALIFAVKNENKWLVEFLIKRGADLNLRAKNGNSALAIAKRLEFVEIEEMLWKAGAIDHSTGNTCLIEATLRKNIPLIQQQIARAVNLNVQNLEGSSALSIAVGKNDTKVVNLLLEAGANLNLQEKNGYTPLLRVAFSGNSEIAPLLIAKGANLKLRAYDGSTPLHLAAKRNNINTLKLLIASGIDLDAQNKERLTALKVAKAAGHEAIVKLLMEAGAIDENGKTPLMRAIENDQLTDFFKLLAEKANGNHKIDLNAHLERKPDLNALLLCSFKGNVVAFIALIKAGVKMIPRSRGMQSSFAHMILSFRKEDIVKYRTLMEFLFPLSAAVFVEEARTSGQFLMRTPDSVKSLYEKVGSAQEVFKYLFLCNMTSITENIFKIIENELESLQKEFPESRAYGHQLLTRHLKMLPPVIAKSEQSVPAAPSVKLNVFLSLFKTINFSDPKKMGYAHPRLLKDDEGNAVAVKTLETQLALYVKRIKNQEPFLGTPPPGTPELKDYYTRLTNIAAHLALKIKEPTIDPDAKTSLLIDLANAASHCGARYMMDSYFWYQRIVKPEIPPITVPEKIFKTLTEFRESIFDELVLTQRLKSNELVPEGNLPHVRNQYLNLIGDELGLPGTASTHEDRAFNLDHLTKESAKLQFSRLYNPATAIAHLESVLLNPSASGLKYQEVIAWFEENVPADWKPDFCVKLAAEIAYKIENEEKEFTEFSSEKRERLMNNYMEEVVFANYQFKWQDKHLETPYSLENIEKVIDACQGLTANRRQNMKEGIGRAILAFKDPTHLSKLRLKKLLNDAGIHAENLDKWRDSIPQLRSQAYLQEEVCLADGTQGFKFSALVYMLTKLKAIGLRV